jgi:hypothetical protein
MLRAMGETAGDHPDRAVYGQAPRRATDRKLRLFACALLRLGDPWAGPLAAAAEAFADGEVDADALRRVWVPRAGAVSGGLAAPELAAGWAASLAAHKSVNHGADGAPLLREVVGNPWRVVRLPRGRRPCGFCGGRGSWSVFRGPGASNPGFVGCKRCDERGWFEDARCPWLTPDVLSLALAAYRERPGRACGRCLGVGGIDQDPIGGPDRDDGRLYVEAPPSTWVCPDCKGAGRLEDGALDSCRLAVLADCLEEAGCAEEALLRHLRGWEECPSCADPQTWGPEWCDGWVPLRGPHARGCWATDLILGKS